jgi:hypothetical protein
MADMNALSLPLYPIASAPSPALPPDGTDKCVFDMLIGGHSQSKTISALDAPPSLPVPPTAETAEAMVAILDRSATMLPVDKMPVALAEPGILAMSSGQPGIIPLNPAQRSGTPVAPRREARLGKGPVEPDVGDTTTFSEDMALPPAQPAPGSIRKSR